MKKKNVSPQPLTKADLEAVLAKYPTKDDLKNELKKYATKGGILKLEFKLTDLEQRIDEKAQGYRDQILTKLDETMGELGVMREENTIGSGQTSQLRDAVEDHEERIKRLEKAQASA